MTSNPLKVAGTLQRPVERPRSRVVFAALALLVGVGCDSARPGGSTGPLTPPGPQTPNDPPPASPTPPPPSAPPPGARDVRVVYVIGDRLVAMNGDFTGRVELAQGDFADLAVSPNGGRIAFTRANNVFVMNIDATDIRQLTTQGGRDPSWSTDGSRIAFVGPDDGIHTMLADGSSSRRLTIPRVELGERDYAPAWSPDGRRIVFTRWEDGEFTVLWMMNVDGTDVARLGRREPFGTSFRTWASWTPVWAASVNRIVFGGPNSSIHASVFSMKADGTDAVGVYTDPTLAGMFLIHDASPDGHWILVTKTYSTAIYLVTPGQLIRLTGEDGSHSPAFQWTTGLSVAAATVASSLGVDPSTRHCQM